ncbi:major facilitator superfamily domain-containing protein [Lasiosphaeria miniovina]|uniref:Major facilitator superfamily domain-containing protein n=1 Tax=Lasiosphaeria miniovina TaxID=1954250 RepID=A0AA40B618_9PEZI|nr:major facilitator superfamily domain-containing protein [Lasiosphaeria miniovina]KAK0728381.1 major facilitator superfamily domain-containing protein [Lasiosphaeria miniovina]
MATLAPEAGVQQVLPSFSAAPERSDETTPLLASESQTGLAKPPSNGGTNGVIGGANGDSNNNGGDDEAEVTVLAHEISTTRLAITLGAAYVGVFLGAVDASIIATLSAPISSEFHSLSLLSWLASAYLIANASCQPLSGRLTDIFGRGPGLVFSNVMFAAGNLICGLSQNQETIIFGRVVAGIGGGGLMSISSFLASDLVPLRKRGVIQGIGNIAYGSGAMIGGVLGGLLNDLSSWGWRLAFLSQVPIILVSAVIVFFLVDVPPKISNKSLLARIDFTGSFLTVAFLVLLLLGLNAGGNLVPWTDPLVLISIPLSLVMLVTFVWWESRARQPIIPVRLLLHRTILAACITSLLCTMVTMVTMFYLPLYLQVLGYSATQAGLRLLAAPLGVAFASIGCGYVMKRTGQYVGLGIGTLCVFTAGVATLTALNESSAGWITFVTLGLQGAGYGGMLTVTLLACIAAVDHDHQAVITSATYAFRSVGATVGITIASAVYQNILKTQLWDRFGHLPGAAEEIARIRDDLGELSRLPEGWHDGVMASFMAAFRGVWLTALAISVVALFSMSLMRQHKLHSNLARQED